MKYCGKAGLDSIRVRVEVLEPSAGSERVRGLVVTVEVPIITRGVHRAHGWVRGIGHQKIGAR